MRKAARIRGLRKYRQEMPITLYIAGGSFELADRYSTEEVLTSLDSDHEGRLSFDLSEGDEILMHVPVGCDWLVRAERRD